MADNFLLLNNDKTEMMIFAPGCLAFSDRSDIRNLGIFDRAICFNNQVRSFFFSISGTLHTVELRSQKKKKKKRDGVKISPHDWIIAMLC